MCGLMCMSGVYNSNCKWCMPHRHMANWCGSMTHAVYGVVLWPMVDTPAVGQATDVCKTAPTLPHQVDQPLAAMWNRTRSPQAVAHESDLELGSSIGPPPPVSASIPACCWIRWRLKSSMIIPSPKFDSTRSLVALYRLPSLTMSDRVPSE